MKKYVLDANCFIDAMNSSSTSHVAIHKILLAAKQKILEVCVSLHTIHELEKKNDGALNLAQSLPKVSHWPIGMWKEQVGSWDQQSGTWDDARKNQEIQEELEELAKSGNDVRDRGAFIDALCSGCDGFITSDKQFVGKGPAERINDRFATKVLNPKQVVNEILGGR